MTGVYQRGLLMALGLLTCAACGKSSSDVGPTPPENLSLTCPADLSVNAEAAPAAAAYTSAVAKGGTPPLNVTCAPASGTVFPEGATTVGCTGIDAVGRRAQCTFRITIHVVPRLQGTRFLAFGDSMTAGETGVGSAPAFGIFNIDQPHSYPTVLEGLLRTRYSTQAASIDVTNAGKPLETAVAGQARLDDLIRTGALPDVLLLLEGVNDVNSAVQLSPSDVFSALSADVSGSYRLGVRLVIISTLPPQAPELCGSGVECRADNPAGVLDVNDLIRTVALQQHAVLVDAYAAFLPSKSTLIGPDGLHPSAEGYRTLANLFLDATAANFETPAITAPTPARAGTVRRAPRQVH